MTTSDHVEIISSETGLYKQVDILKKLREEGVNNVSKNLISETITIDVLQTKQKEQIQERYKLEKQLRELERAKTHARNEDYSDATFKGNELCRFILCIRYR